MPKFLEAVSSNLDAKVFKVGEVREGKPDDWDLEPLTFAVLSESDGNSDWLFIVRAFNIQDDGGIRRCFICLSERINDYAYFVERGLL